MTLLSRTSPTDQPAYPQLTPERLFPVAWRTVFLSLIGVVLLVVALNTLLLSYLRQNGPNRGYWLVRAKWQLLAEQSTPVDWLILGDSTANQGVDPAVITAVTAQSALNLGTVANMNATDDAWLLRNYIARYGPPEAIIYQHAYQTWARAVNPVFVAQTPLSLADLGRQQPPYVPGIQDRSALLLARYAPLYADNQSLRTVVSELLRRPGLLMTPRFRLTTAGFMVVAESNSDRVQRDAAAHRALARERPFQPNPSATAALLAVADLAQTHHLPVYVIDAPIEEALAADPYVAAYRRAVQDYLAASLAGYEEMVLLGPSPDFPAAGMENADHLTAAMAAQHTRNILTAIPNR